MRIAMVVLVSVMLFSTVSDAKSQGSSIIWIHASYHGRPFYHMTLLPDGRLEININEVVGEYLGGNRRFSGSVDPILVDLLRALLDMSPKMGDYEQSTGRRLRLTATFSDGTSSHTVHLTDKQCDYKNLARRLIVLINNLITDYDLDSQNYLDVGLVDQLSRVYAQETRWLRVGLGILTLFVILQSIALVGIIWKQKR